MPSSSFPKGEKEIIEILVYNIWITTKASWGYHTANGSASFHISWKCVSCKDLRPRRDNPDWVNFSNSKYLLAAAVSLYLAPPLKDNSWECSAEPE